MNKNPHPIGSPKWGAYERQYEAARERRKNIEKPRNEEFCLRFQVDSRHVRLLARPDGNTNQWDRDASHWQVEIYRPGKGLGKSIVTYYSMGSAHFFPPLTIDVMNSLMTDSQLGECDFRDFCDNLGYDVDSRKAFDCWQTCRKTREELHQLFTREEIQELTEFFQDY
jgi:hypothetical protein